MDENELVKAAQHGDTDAFCTLYANYEKRLYSYAFFRLQNREDAQDAVQDCVLSAFEQIGQLRNAEAFPAWIFRILYCSCANMLSDQIRRRGEESMENCQHLYSDSDQSFVVRQELAQALNQLREQDKSIVLLSVVGGLKSKEIAKITGLTAGNVRQKLRRSLDKLKKQLL